jgi:hypothetical protein
MRRLKYLPPAAAQVVLFTIPRKISPSVAEVVAVGSRTLSKAEAFIKETGLQGSAKAYGRYGICKQELDRWY